jgi:protein-disulfide isomerase
METNPDFQTGPTRPARKFSGRWLITGGIGTGLLVIFALVGFGRWQYLRLAAGTSLTATSPAPMQAAPALGPQNAPVTIIEYADFGCPSCWYWYKAGVLDQLRAKYGDQIRFVWRDYAVITLGSPLAAEAGQCANDQGKFWQFHDAVYNNDGAILDGDLHAYATAIGLNMSQFNTCLSSHRYHDRVLAEQTEAFTHGYLGAPFFLINGEPLIGMQPLSAFSTLIDPLLAAKK